MDVTVDSPGFSAESFWRPRHLILSAWLGHAPFAAWLLNATRPRVLAELGTHTGFSFFAFAETARRLAIDTKLYALDNWVGDDHAGFYGEDIYQSVKSIAESDYPTSTELLRGYFSDSVGHFADGSIDLLHIDGRHGYEDVKEDYETYLPKLSDRAVVIFHDTNEFDNDFGVHRFWDEISATAPSFNFHHEHGLGVLQVGASAPAEVGRFLAAANADPDAMRSAYAELGALVSADFYDRDALEASRADVARLLGELHQTENRERGLQDQLDAVHLSTSWKVTRPLRALRGGSAS